jgi:hypothetical protein
MRLGSGDNDIVENDNAQVLHAPTHLFAVLLHSGDAVETRHDAASMH